MVLMHYTPQHPPTDHLTHLSSLALTHTALTNPDNMRALPLLLCTYHLCAYCYNYVCVRMYIILWLFYLHRCKCFHRVTPLYSSMHVTITIMY